MPKNLFSRTYTTYPKPDCDYTDNSRGTWIHISDEQQDKAITFLNKHNQNIFSRTNFETSDYLIKGNIVRTNHSTFPDLTRGWDFKIYSETQKGLEDIIGELGLPLEFN